MPPPLPVGGAHPLAPACMLFTLAGPSGCTSPRRSQGSGHMGPSSVASPSGRGGRCPDSLCLGPVCLAWPPPQVHVPLAGAVQSPQAEHGHPRGGEQLPKQPGTALRGRVSPELHLHTVLSLSSLPTETKEEALVLREATSPACRLRGSLSGAGVSGQPHRMALRPSFPHCTRVGSPDGSGPALPQAHR